MSNDKRQAPRAKTYIVLFWDFGDHVNRWATVARSAEEACYKFAHMRGRENQIIKAFRLPTPKEVKK